MISDNAILSLSTDMTYQEMGEDEPAVILQLSTGRLFTCNQTTRAFLDQLDGRRSFAEAVNGLLEQFSVCREKLASDLGRLTEQLLEAGLVETR